MLMDGVTLQSSCSCTGAVARVAVFSIFLLAAFALRSRLS